MVTVSIVSHGHGAMVEQLVRQLLLFPEVGQIILTYNIPEVSNLSSSEKLEIIVNNKPAGFAANHNAAFQRCRESFFCILNPDIELSQNLFPELLSCITKHKAALVAPLVLSPEGKVEDSIRRFPTPYLLLSKIFGGDGGKYSIIPKREAFFPDWTAGMFMLFNSSAFAEIGGFDPKFFLYYEDVDICARLWKTGQNIAVCPSVSVVHAARRDSHHSLRFMRWHLASLTRYFFKHYGRLPQNKDNMR